jgi:hypothetical protein
MAAPDVDVSDIVALTNKRYELVGLGHTARANAYSARVLAAAKAFGVRDCLIVAYLQIAEVEDIYTHAQQATDMGEKRRLHTQAVELLAVAVASLQRRHAADTLLAGCHSYEVEWYTRTMENIVSADGGLPGSPTHHGRMVSSFGHHTFLNAAATPTLAVCTCPISPQVLRSFWRFIADAADALLAVRLSMGSVARQTAELALLRNVRNMLGQPRRTLQQDAVETPRLLETWRRVEECGLLVEQQVDRIEAVRDQLLQRLAAAEASAAAAPGLRRCGLPGCGARETHPDHFKTCAACRKVGYCSKEHQTEHWPDHKAPCKAARKAAEQRHDA